MGQKDKLQDNLSALFIGDPADTEATVKRYFNPEYTQVTDGHTSDFAGFVAHVNHLRSATREVSFEVHEFLRNGDQIADRHTIKAVMQNGKTTEFEILLFGTLDNEERLLKVVESTRQVSGDESEANLGHQTRFLPLLCNNHSTKFRGYIWRPSHFLSNTDRSWLILICRGFV